MKLDARPWDWRARPVLGKRTADDRARPAPAFAPRKASARPLASWLVLLLAVGLAELTILLYVLLGPQRFEHSGLAIAARLGRIAPAEAAIALPGGLIIRRVDSVGLYQRAIDLARSPGEEAAASLYTATFARVSGSNLPYWLKNQAPHDQVQSAWQVFDGHRWIEVGWVTSDGFRYSGLPTADGIYWIEIQRGKIAEQDGNLTSTTRAWLLGMRSPVAVGGWPSLPGRVVLVAILFVFAGGGALLLRGAPGSRLSAAAFLALLPVLTILAFTLVDTTGSPLAKLLPDGVLFHSHATLAVIAEHLGDPRGAALQWIKAISHRHSDAEIAQAARGIVQVRGRPGVGAMLCGEYEHGAPWTRAAIARAGIRC